MNERSRSRTLVTRSIVFGLALSAGCIATTGQLREISVGFVGCLPDEVIIANETGGTVESWSATCRGITFWSSRIAGKSRCAAVSRARLHVFPPLCVVSRPGTTSVGIAPCQPATPRRIASKTGRAGSS